MLLQPIIENSIKHAISKSEDGGTLHVLVNLCDNHLKIELSDSGTDIYADNDSNKIKQNRSIGMANTTSRLEAIYPNRYRLTYDLTEGRFKTHIKIPFELAPNPAFDMPNEG